MIVKELFEKANPENVFIAYTLKGLEDGENWSYQERFQIHCSLRQKIAKFLETVSKIEPKQDNDGERIVFVIEEKEDDYDNKHDTYMSSFCVKKDEFIEKSGKPFTLWNDEAGNRIEHYAYEMTDWEVVVGYHVSTVSVERYGIDIVVAFICQEMVWFGFDDSDRKHNLEKFHLNLKASIEEVEEGNLTSFEDAETMFRELNEEFEAKLSEEEREEWRAGKEADKIMEPFRHRFRTKVRQEVHQENIRMLEEESKYWLK